MQRSASNDPERFKGLARELAAAKVDVFFAPATPMATAAWYADKNTPIVVATDPGPCRAEFREVARAARHARDRRHDDERRADDKRLQLMMETVPGLKRVGVVIDDAMRTACTQEIDHLEQSAKKLGLTLVMVHVDRPEAMEAGFRKLVDAQVQAVTTLLRVRPATESRKEYAEAALRLRLPSMYEQRPQRAA